MSAFVIGDRVQYSDLSPWEEAEVINVYPATRQLKLRFIDDSSDLTVDQHGVRPI